MSKLAQPGCSLPRLAILDEMRRYGPTPEVISLATAVDACVPGDAKLETQFVEFLLVESQSDRDDRNVGQHPHPLNPGKVRPTWKNVTYIYGRSPPIKGVGIGQPFFLFLF